MKLNDKLSVLFLLEGSKICSDGKMPIYVRITVVGSSRAEMSLGRKVFPHEWDQENERVIVNSKNKELAIINTIIQKYKAKLETDFFILDSQFKIVSSQMLKRRFLGLDEKEEEKKHQEEIKRLEEENKKLEHKEKKGFDLDVYDQIDEYIKVKSGKVDPETIDVYENMKSHLLAFEKFRGGKIAFESFDFNFYDSLVDFLTYHYVQSRFKVPVVGLKINSMAKTIKHLKGFIKDRIKRKIIAPIDLTDFKVPDEETDAIYLTFNEIAAIYHTDLSRYPYLVPDRNRFIVACLSGLRFSDFSTLVEIPGLSVNCSNLFGLIDAICRASRILFSCNKAGSNDFRQATSGGSRFLLLFLLASYIDHVSENLQR